MRPKPSTTTKLPKKYRGMKTSPETDTGIKLEQVTLPPAPDDFQQQIWSVQSVVDKANDDEVAQAGLPDRYTQESPSRIAKPTWWKGTSSRGAADKVVSVGASNIEDSLKLNYAQRRESYSYRDRESRRLAAGAPDTGTLTAFNSSPGTRLSDIVNTWRGFDMPSFQAGFAGTSQAKGSIILNDSADLNDIAAILNISINPKTGAYALTEQPAITKMLRYQGGPLNSQKVDFSSAGKRGALDVSLARRYAPRERFYSSQESASQDLAAAPGINTFWRPSGKVLLLGGADQMSIFTTGNGLSLFAPSSTEPSTGQSAFVDSLQIGFRRTSALLRFGVKFQF